MDPFLGEIRVVAFNFVPAGWAACNGASLPINQNQALFALLGTQYGGDGTTTFNLPNLPDAKTHAVAGKDTAAPVHNIIAVNGMFPSRP
ncbi:phage tail protein [Tunturiibacter gelidoferens]|uniref:Microcystin-dependent protein n=3 Tax=Tunturiibacter TaxID=3154218 RepID=A0A7Y9T2D4_9BACT|nr:tail fiber protein [Edaphobacter lichenicola]MBB5339624.1 microcystin-dependent protein [Edaphobacter lichenicola]NYF51056.1 microcystin-dependent protein [Edaphobacter lichenicola]